MNYKKIYDQIIFRATLRRQNHEKIKNAQKHHIVPRCMNGVDDFSNIVFVTLREHFICHLLLCKMYPHNKGLFCAFNLMHNVYKGKQKIKINSRLYESLKNEAYKLFSARMKENNPAKGKPAYNKGKPVSEETKRKISIAISGKNNGMYGRKQSKEGRARISEANKRRVWTPEMRAKTGRRGKNHPQYGKSPSEESKLKRKISLCYRTVKRYPTNVIDLYYWDSFVQKTELNILSVLEYFKSFENVLSYINNKYNKNYICKNNYPFLFNFIKNQNTNIPHLFINKYNIKISKKKVNSYYTCFIKDHIYHEDLQKDFCNFVNCYYFNKNTKSSQDLKTLPFDALFKDYQKLVQMYCKQNKIIKTQEIMLFNSIDQFLSVCLSSIINNKRSIRNNR